MANGKIMEKRSQKTTLSTLRFLVVMGQYFALLPVNGVSSTRVFDLRFTWKSFNFFYTISYLICTTLTLLISAIYYVESGIKLPEFVENIFYVCGLLTAFFYLRLAKVWPVLMMECTKVDVAMERNYNYPKRLVRDAKIFAFIILLAAIVEYLLSIAFRVVYTKVHFGTLDGFLYYTNAFPQIFHSLPYSPISAALLQSLSVISTFSWTYNELFLIVMSTTIAERFKQITARLKTHHSNSNRDRFWMEIREDYDRLAILCKLLDDKLSMIVLLSFAKNLFFILIQLFHSLRGMHGVVEKIYFYYSFGFLIFRTVAVSLYAASINEESKGPLTVLYSVPSNVYNEEIKRLILQISFDDVALTGSKLFKVTRGLVLSVAGAIVTYELILMRFVSSNIE